MFVVAEEGEEQDMADHSEVAEATPMDTHPPPDPTKGLPQLFRSRRLSSDFSEDGDNADSRRSSISNGASMRTPGVATESVLIKADDIRGTDVSGKSAVVEAMITEEARVLSPSTVQKVNVFDVAFSQKLSDCLLYTSPSPRDATLSRMPSSA